jgi:small subunit ribosomal protein S17
MADEEQNENVEETTAPAEAEAPEAVEAEAAEAPEAASKAGDDAAQAKPAAGASPKEQRRKARAERVAKEAGSRPTRTPEERQAERDAARKARASGRRTARAKTREKAAAARAAAPAAEPTPPREHGEGRQKERQGVVVSDKADKTITVRVDTARQHRRYHKIVRSSTTLHAHDESNDAHTGDTVIVRESRPLSRLKRWRLVEVVERAR